jgi:WD40 repeat protein
MKAKENQAMHIAWLKTTLVCMAILSLDGLGQAQSQDSYTKVERSDLLFAFAVGIKGYTRDSAGDLTDIEGVVTEFTLAGKSISLETDRLVAEGGKPGTAASIFVLTKKFGKVKVTWDLLGGEEIWLTPSQKKQFYEFRSQPAPSERGERVFVHRSYVFAVAFSPDALSVATGTDEQDGRIKLWGSATGRLKGLLAAPKTVVALAFSPDGKTLASGQSGEAPVRIWDTAKAVELAVLSKGDFGNVRPSIQCVTYGPRGSILTATGPEHVIYVWDPTNRTLLHSLRGHPSTLTALTFSPDGTILASSSCGPGRTRYDPGALKIWNLSTGDQLADLKGHAGYIDDLAFSADGGTLISVGYTRDHKGEVLFWDVAVRQQKDSFKGILKGVTGMALSPDGRILATAGDDGIIHLWDISERTHLQELRSQTGRLKPMAFSPNGKMLATGSRDGTVRIWDLPLTKLK